jgi:hypothetical protein
MSSSYDDENNNDIAMDKKEIDRQRLNPKTIKQYDAKMTHFKLYNVIQQKYI